MDNSSNHFLNNFLFVILLMIVNRVVFTCSRAADGQVQREAPTAPDPLGGHGLRGRGRDVAHRASLSEPSQGRVVKGGGARGVQKPGGATQPAARAHTQPGQGAFAHSSDHGMKTQMCPSSSSPVGGSLSP